MLPIPDEILRDDGTLKFWCIQLPCPIFTSKGFNYFSTSNYDR